MAYTDDTDLNAGMPGGGLLGGSSGGWLGNLLNFSGGRSTTADLYGDLFSKKQLAAIQKRESDAKFAGLLGAINQFAAPSEFKKGWGQLLGTAGQAMLGAEGGDKAAESALKGGLTAQKIAQLKQEAAASEQYQAAIKKIMEQWVASGGAPGTMPPGMQPPGAPAAPPGAPAAPPGASPPGPGNGPPPAGNAPPPPQGTFGLPGSAPWQTPNWGLPPPPKSAGLPQDDPTQQFAGLLGGGALPPFSPEEGSSLSPPDTVIPSSGPGGLLDPGAVKLASSRGGLNAPGWRPEELDWARRNAPFPTVAKGAAEPIRWQHDTPEIDPNDPASQGPGSPFGPGPGAPTDNRDTVVNRPPVDPRVRAGMIRAQAGGARGPATASGPFLPDMPVPPNLPGGGGSSNQPIPGIGVSPQGLAILDLFAAGAGKGTPFKGLTDTFYKDPAYLKDAAAAAAAGTLPYDRFKTQESQATQYRYNLLAKMAEDGMTLDREGNIVRLPAVGDIKAENAAKQAEVTEKWKAMFQPVPGGVDVRGPNGTTQKIAMTQYELKRRQDEAAKRPGMPSIGDPVGVPTFTQEELKTQELDQKFLEDKRGQAEVSRRSILEANDMRELIQKGVVAGSYSDERTGLLKLGQLLKLTGKDENDLIRNTEAYIASHGRRLKEGLKGLGPPISNTDLITAEKTSGGQNLTVAGMLELLRIEEKYNRIALKDYGRLLKSAPPSRYDKSVKEPPVFGSRTGTDESGNRHWYDEDDKQWKPL